MFVKFVSIIFVIMNLTCFAVNPEQDFVTYGHSYGRFGDNLLSYMHAKWVSHSYGVPLLYKPFIHSEELVLHSKEQQFESVIVSEFNVKRDMKSGEKLHAYMRSDETPTIFLIPYFSESSWEHKTYARRFAWPRFNVDWDNKAFKSKIKRLVSPKEKLELVSIPNDKISVCIHIRTGYGYDDEDVNQAFPLKFPSMGYYLKQLKNIYETLGKRALYVHFFSDTPDLSEVKKLFEDEFEHDDIEFGGGDKSDIHNNSVLEDFFSMTKFDCIILSESNFSYCVSLISDFMIKISPKKFHFENGEVIIDDVCFKLNRGEI